MLVWCKNDCYDNNLLYESGLIDGECIISGRFVFNVW